MLSLLASRTYIFAFVATVLVVGCDRTPPPVEPTMTYTPPTPVVIAPTPAPAVIPVTRTGVFIDPDIMSACKIPQPKSYFEFDSSDLRSSDLAGLEGVAGCFRDGALKGKSMIIVGRADPRGTEKYNMQLGQERADSVSTYLGGKGVGAGQMMTRSTGKEKAKGTDADSWAQDRRVDIRLNP